MPGTGLTVYPASALLLRALISPAEAARLSESDWDAVVRVGRSTRLLGTLRCRLDEAGVLTAIPSAVRRQLESDYMLARFQAQMTRHQTGALAKILAPLDAPLVLLKGAAYVLQGLACGAGRFTSDVDLMIPRAYLDAAEARLEEAGWAFEELDAYDERYYRVWSHELPPLRCEDYYLELDLHHTILPLTGRIQPNAQALFDASIPVPGTAFRALCPADQVLHACAHLAQDSDFSERLRDLVDVDALLREHSAVPGFWDTLLARAQLHGLGRPLWYALRYCHEWLSTPIPDSVADRLRAWAPFAVVVRAMDWLVSRAIFPTDPDRTPGSQVRFARALLLLRSHWLRMPPPLLIRHAVVKAMRRFMSRRPAAVEA
jgi:hypothetical protein